MSISFFVQALGFYFGGGGGRVDLSFQHLNFMSVGAVDLIISASISLTCRDTLDFTSPYSGLGAHCFFHRFFPCCAKTACSRLMKLSDF